MIHAFIMTWESEMMVGDVKLLTGNFLVIRMMKPPSANMLQMSDSPVEAWWLVFAVYSSVVLKQNIGTIAALSVFTEVLTVGPVKI